MDLDGLLAPRSGENVSGENLEYDQLFVEMELAAEPEESHQIGDHKIEGAEPDYGKLADAAMAILEKSHDLRAATFLAVAKFRRGGFAEARQVVSYMRRVLEDHWDTCYPEVEDDGADVTMRSNAVLTLSDADTMMPAIRNAPITESPSFGKMTFRDVQVAEGEVQPREGQENPPDLATVEAAFQDTPDDWKEALFADLDGIVEDVQAIEAVFDEKAPGLGPDLEATRKLVARIRKRIPGGEAGGPAEEEAADDSGGDAVAAPAAGGAPAAVAAPGVIASSQDVKAALDRIITYYQRHEPSSPVPVLIERAKRLVDADFLTIVKDMAPSGMDNVRTVGGLEEEDDY